MSSEIARQGSQQNPEEAARLFNYDGFADLGELGWNSLIGLIAAAPIEIQSECCEIAGTNPCALLTSFTHNLAVAQRIPELAQQGVTFERITNEICELYILREVGRRFQEAQSQIQCFVQDKYAHFQDKMAEMATQWMEMVQRQFRQQLMSTNLLRTRLKALEEAHEKGCNIDAENNVEMAQAPPLEIVKTGYQSVTILSSSGDTCGR